MLRINMKIMVDGKEFIEKERYTWKLLEKNFVKLNNYLPL